MIVRPSDYYALDYSKYNRVFVFGCSFTNYFWPTWAHILSYEASNAKFFNFGLGAAGNLYIAERLSAANQQYNFTSTDLVVIMWTTFFREDRYLKNKWYVHGNIFNNSQFNSVERNFYSEYSCIRGCIIRDFAIINLAKAFLQSGTFDSVMLAAIDIDFITKNISNMGDVIKLYKSLFDYTPTSLFNFVSNTYKSNFPKLSLEHLDNSWPVSHSYLNDHKDCKQTIFYEDRHPTPEMYLRYLQSLKLIKDTDIAKKCLRMNNELLQIKSSLKIETWYNNIVKNMENYFVCPQLL